MKRVLLFLGFFISAYAFCQNSKVDSIRNVIKTTQSDSVKIQALIGLAGTYRNEHPDTMIILATKAKALADKLGHPLDIAKAQHLLGWGYYFKGNYAKALEFYFSAIGILEKSEKNAAPALRKLIAAERADIYNNTGNLYYGTREADKAIGFYTKGLEIAEMYDLKKQIINLIGNIGLIYDQQGDATKALLYYKRALKLNEDIGNKGGVVNNLTNIGGVYYTQKKIDLAIDYYTKAMKICEEIDYKYGLLTNLTNLGFIYNEQVQLEKAQQVFERSLQLAIEINKLEEIKFLHLTLSQLCEHRGQIQNALDHYKAYDAAKDSLVNEENTKKTVKLEMQYEFNQKEAAAKMEQEKKDGIALAENKKQRVIFYSVCGVLLLVIGFAVFAYRSFLQKRKDNIAITEQKQIIAEKQKEIVDSIKYAKRIQTAHMPTDKYIEKNMDRLKS